MAPARGGAYRLTGIVSLSAVAVVARVAAALYLYAIFDSPPPPTAPHYSPPRPAYSSAAIWRKPAQRHFDDAIVHGMQRGMEGGGEGGRRRKWATAGDEEDEGSKEGTGREEEGVACRLSRDRLTLLPPAGLLASLAQGGQLRPAWASPIVLRAGGANSVAWRRQAGKLDS